MRRLGLVLSVGLLAVGCGASRSAMHGGEGIVSPAGKVGPLTLGVATEAAVERFTGRPDFSGVGTFNGPNGPLTPSFTALAYDCSPHESKVGFPPTGHSHTYCRTIYFINSKTRRLGAFWTSSPRFHTRYGTHPGSKQSYANAHEDALPATGCRGASLSRSTPAAVLVMDNSGGRPHVKTIKGPGTTNGFSNHIAITTTITGGVVSDFALEQAAGVFGKFSSAVPLLNCS